jgi:hypothetical protein
MLMKIGKNRALTILNILALVVISYYAFREFALPTIAESLYKEQYKELVFKCDNVMRDHFIAKSQVLARPSSQTIANLRSAEVGLIDCHQYDVLRKRLLSLGLSETDLARIGLEAIEKHATDVRAFVETHEIRY